MIDLTLAAVFAAGIVAVVAIRSAQSRKKDRAGEYNADVQATTDDIYVDTGFDAKDVFISGLAHHAGRKDVGMFTGVIYNETSNPVDGRAMAVWDNRSQKILGHVPAAVLDEYYEYSGGKRCECIGYVYDDGEHLRGRVRAYRKDADRESVIRDMDEYAAQVCAHFGWKRP